jgi:hypothetical protein
VPYPVLLSGTRPNDLDWYRVDAPDWYVAEGWSLTPEAAGVSQADRRGLRLGAIEGRVRTIAVSGAALVFGGRNFDQARPTVTVNIGNVWRHTFAVDAGPFLHVQRLPMYKLDSTTPNYLPLTIVADPAATIGIEQFDVAPSARPTGGFGKGWHERELNSRTGERWRWLSDAGEFTYSAAAATVLRIEGESPLKYYSKPSRLVVRAGAVILRDLSLSSDFAVDIPLAPSLEPSTITFETDQTHVPAERSWRASADRRRLGLRIHSLSFAPFTASGPGTATSFPPVR